MPLEALALLIFETKNDFIRFHGEIIQIGRPVIIDPFPAYQSALLVIPLILLRVLAALAQFPSWLQTLCTLLLVVPMLFMAYVHKLIHINSAPLG